MKKLKLAIYGFIGLFVLAAGPIARGATGSFTGSYATNFNGLGTSGTTMPLGFRTMSIAGANTLYTSALPISTAGIASATASGTQTLTVWNAGSAVASSSTALFNVGSWGNNNDRALGSDCTGVGAMVIELSLTNNTGADLLGVTFSYDLKVMTNGSAGTEASELPGYAFFYSTSGGTTAAEWTRVEALCLTNSTQGTTTSSGNVSINFSPALTNRGRMFFRWADDNNVASSPDQMIAIDNIAITASTNTAPSVVITSPAANSSFVYGTNIDLTINASDANGSVTKVEYFAGATKLGESLVAPFGFTWTNVPLGAYALTAKATDNEGATGTSSTLNITNTPEPGVGGLYFDGVNDYVTFGTASAIGVSNFTVECWFKRQGPGATTSTGTGGVTAYPLVTKGRGEADGSNVDCNFFFGINSANNTLTADFEDFNSGLNHPITGVNGVVSNGWQHGAVTFDCASGTWVLYLNGLPDTTNVITGAVAVRLPRFDSIQHAGLGTAMTSAGAAQGFFQGTMDEVRIWNYARSAAEISASYTNQIESAAGLIARWSLDDGTGTTAANTGTSGLSGTLLNGPLWVAGYPFGGPPQVNLPPSAPVTLAPPNGATGLTNPVTLSVRVDDLNDAPLTVTFYGRPKPGPAGRDFTLIALPDTQFYSQTYSNVFTNQTDWIITNRAAMNIVYVPQLGDCVQSGDNGGNDYEWRNATNALYRLENPLTTLLPQGIPYGVAIGNHDQGATGNGVATDTTRFYNQYFGTNHFLPYNYYGGNFGTNNDNHYDLFSASGLDFIVIYFEYDTTLTDTNAPVLVWANNLLQTYASRRAIVVSHWIINSYTANSSFGAQGQTIYNALKGNPNLTLMLCGHINPDGEGRRVDTFNGNPVWTLLSDYQDLANGGNGWLRIYEFSPSNNVVRAKTYSPWLNQFQTGTNSQFTIPYAMNGSSFVPLGTVSGIAPGGTANLAWNGLNTNTTYEWYAVVSDGALSATGPVSSFTTDAQFPAAPPFVTLTNPVSGTSLVAPAMVNFGAAAFDAGGSIVKVEFYSGPAKLGEDTSAPYVLTWSNVLAGSYALTAVATDNDGMCATSSVVNLTITNPPPALLTRGPYLQSGSHTNTYVRWRTDVSVQGRVVWGPAPDALTNFVFESPTRTEHEINLTGLKPDTRYYYAVGSATTNLAGGNTNFFFVTAPSPGLAKPTRIWVLGDPGTANSSQTAVKSAYYAMSPSRHTDLWLMLGDDAYNAGLDSEFQNAVFNMYPEMLRKSVLWSTLGNHETDQATAASTNYNYFKIFTFPTQGEAGGVPSGTEQYYSFDYGNIHFICLDSMTSSRATNGAMANWLRSDLAAANSTWMIAFWHHPPYTKGSHNSDTETELIEMRQNFLPILEDAGVDLVLSGHSHCYERSYLLDGHYGSSTTFSAGMKVNGGSGNANTTGAYTKGYEGHQGAVYAVAGSSGQASGGSLNHPAMFVSLNQLGSMVLDVTGNRLDAIFLRENGTTNDTFSVIKPAPVMTVTITNPVNGAVFNAGTSFNLQAITSVTNGSIVQVEFFAGTNSLGVDATADYGVSVPPLAPGVYTLSAVATDNLGGRATNSIAITVRNTPLPGDVIFNEYVADNDANGNDFFELLVLKDNLDLRGLRVSDNEIAVSSSNNLNNGEAVFVFGNDDYLSHVPAGTLIAVYTATTGITTDTNVNPAGGDWKMVLVPGTGVTATTDGLGGSVNTGFSNGGDALYLYLPGPDGNSGGTDNIYLDYIAYKSHGSFPPPGIASVVFTAPANDGYFLGNTAQQADSTGWWVTYDGLGNGTQTPGEPNFGQDLNPLRGIFLAPEVKVAQTDGGTDVAEGGTTDTYTLALATMPAGPVTVTISADAQAQVSVNGSSFFSSLSVILTNVAPRTITVRAVDDVVIESNPHTGLIQHAITSTGDAAAYPTNLAIAAVTVNITENDFPQPPVITTQPQGRTVDYGAVVTLQVGVTGTSPLQYQWYREGALIASATNATFTIPGVKPADLGGYIVAITNYVGGTAGDPAVLAVHTLAGPFGGFVNKGLVGVGRVPADSFDQLGAHLDTLGGIFSAMNFDIATWEQSGIPGSYTYGGALHALPDRGFGDGTQDYHPRIQDFRLSITPFDGADSGGFQNQIVLSNSATMLLTYGGTNFTGFDPDDTSVTAFPQTTAGSLGHGHRSLDPEGLARRGDGSYYISDEYGPSVLRFSSTGQLLGALPLPAALIPETGAGFPATTNYSAPAALTSGRRSNRGLEGLSLTPDGTRLFAMLQSPAMQDNGAANSATNTRVLVYDVAPGSPTENRLIGEYIYQLTLNGNAATNRNTPISEILALNSRQFLVLERDNIGLGGNDGTSIYKKVVLADLSDASNFLGSDYDREANDPLRQLLVAFPPGSNAVTRVDFVDLIDPTQLVKFGLNADARRDTNSLSEKWEGLALVPMNDPAATNDWLLLIGNDNDFKARDIYHNGQLLSGGNSLVLDNMMLAYRVTLAPAPNLAPTDLAFASTGVPENLAVGTTAGTFAAIDLDSGDSFAFSLVPGAGDLDNGAFTISGNTLLTAVTFNYEARQWYSIRVRVTDSAGNYREEIFAVEVLDVNEPPTGLALTSTFIPEKQSVGTVVGTFVTEDEDLLPPTPDDVHTYSLITLDGCEDNAWFQVSGDRLLTASNFVFTTRSTYRIRVCTTDGGGLHYDREFTLFVLPAPGGPLAALFANNFTGDASGWTRFPGMELTWDGAGHGVVRAGSPAAPTSAVTDWGGYDAATSAGTGFRTSLDLYLDTNTAEGLKFGYLVGLNNPAHSAAEEFAFLLQRTNVEGQCAFRINTGPGAPGSFENPDGSADAPAIDGYDITITNSGWYTFQHWFHQDANSNLVAELSLFDADTNEVVTWEISTALTVGVDVLGNRYGKIIGNEFASLLVDNSRLTVIPRPMALATSVLVNEDEEVPVRLGGEVHPAGATWRYKITTGPLHGTLSRSTGVYFDDPIISYHPAADYFGADSFQFVVSNGSQSSTPAAVSVTVMSVNDAPTFALLGPIAGAGVTVPEDSATKTVQVIDPATVTKGPGNESGQLLNYQVTGYNAALFMTQPVVSSVGSLTFRPAANVSGDTTVAIVAKDNGGTACGGIDTSLPRYLTIHITASNDAPVLAGIAAVTVTEGLSSTPDVVVPLAVSDLETPLGSLQVVVSVESQTGGIVVGPAGEFVGGAWWVRAPILAEASGQATLKVTATDAGDGASPARSVSQSFILKVTAVNDAPGFVLAASSVSSASNVAVTRAAFATFRPNGGMAGDPFEAAQTGTYTVTVSAADKAKFAVQPSITGSGTLTYKFAAGATGSVIATVKVTDNGGTAGGGVNVSPAQTLTFNVGL